MNNDTETAWAPQPATSKTAQPGNTKNQASHLTGKPTGINKPLKPLTNKQKAFIKHLVDNPKDSATKAVQASYGVKSYNSARNIASVNLTKPNIKLELSKYTGTAKSYLLQVLNESSNRLENASDRDYAPIATVLERTANSVIDRVEGKAQSNINVTQQSVNINIDLTSI